jgi:cell division protein FtsB
MKAVWEARKRILVIAGILVVGLVMMNLNSRLGEYFRLSSERDQLASQVTDLQTTKQALETQVAYATSDQAVEDWARSEAHLARPGDKVIVLLTPANQTAVPQAQATPTQRPVANWEIWWALFFSN